MAFKIKGEGWITPHFMLTKDNVQVADLWRDGPFPSVSGTISIGGASYLIKPDFWKKNFKIIDSFGSPVGNFQKSWNPIRLSGVVEIRGQKFEFSSNFSVQK